MHVERMEATAAAIAAEPARFDQRHYLGAAICVAGAAALLADRLARRAGAVEAAAHEARRRHQCTHDVARDWLGLTEEESGLLFAAGWPELWWAAAGVSPSADAEATRWEFEHDHRATPMLRPAAGDAAVLLPLLARRGSLPAAA